MCGNVFLVTAGVLFPQLLVTRYSELTRSIRARGMTLVDTPEGSLTRSALRLFESSIRRQASNLFQAQVDGYKRTKNRRRGDHSIPHRLLGRHNLPPIAKPRCSARPLPRLRSGRSARCYLCKSSEHYARQCPLARRKDICWYCQKQNHPLGESECPEIRLARTKPFGTTTSHQRFLLKAHYYDLEPSTQKWIRTLNPGMRTPVGGRSWSDVTLFYPSCPVATRPSRNMAHTNNAFKEAGVHASLSDPDDHHYEVPMLPSRLDTVVPVDPEVGMKTEEEKTTTFARTYRARQNSRHKAAEKSAYRIGTLFLLALIAFELWFIPLASGVEYGSGRRPPRVTLDLPQPTDPEVGMSDQEVQRVRNGLTQAQKDEDGYVDIKGNVRFPGDDYHYGSFSKPSDFHPDQDMLNAVRTKRAGRNLQTPSHPRHILAYDCSVPIELRTTKLPLRDNCTQPTRQTRHSKVEVLVMQEAKYRRTTVRQCQAWKTSYGYYCGAHDHATPNAKLFQVRVPYPLQAAECALMWSRQRWTDTIGVKRTVDRNDTTFVMYNEVGSEKYTKSWVSWEQECEGAEITIAGQRYTGMVKTVQFEFKLEQKLAMIAANDDVIIFDTQLVLPCPFTQGNCVTTAGTFSWRPAENVECPYKLVRKSMGHLVQMDDQTEAFVATKHMIRLDKGTAFRACGSTLYHTNYPNVALATDTGNEALQESLHPSEMSTILFVKLRDEYLTRYTENLLQNAVRNMRHDMCEHDLLKDNRRWAAKAAEQQVVREGETVSFGDGNFATAAGEVWYQYMCKPVQVRARDTGHCYNALPVQMLDVDLANYNAIRQPKPSQRHQEMVEPKTHHDFFIEPNTHRLTTVAALMECGSYFQPMYQNRENDWIAQDPKIITMKAPTTFSQYVPESHIINDTLHDYVHGGFYTSTAINKMEEFNTFPNAKAAQLWNFIRQIKAPPLGQPFQPYHVFPTQFPEIDLVELSGFWEFAAKWGDVAAITLVIVLLFRSLTWIIGLCLRCNDMAASSQGCNWELLSTLIPTAYFLWKQKRERRAAKSAYIREELMTAKTVQTMQAVDPEFLHDLHDQDRRDRRDQRQQQHSETQQRGPANYHDSRNSIDQPYAQIAARVHEEKKLLDEFDTSYRSRAPSSSQSSRFPSQESMYVSNRRMAGSVPNVQRQPSAPRQMSPGRIHSRSRSRLRRTSSNQQEIGVRYGEPYYPKTSSRHSSCSSRGSFAEGPRQTVRQQSRGPSRPQSPSGSHRSVRSASMSRSRAAVLLQGTMS